MDSEQSLHKITGWLREIYGARLHALAVYGSAAGGNHPSKNSGLHLLAVLDRIDAPTLDAGAPAAHWWKQQGNPPLVIQARQEWEDSADVFPIEYRDIQAHHRLLHGEDLFASVPIYPELHRLQVEHDLRAQLLRLRGAYISEGGNAKALAAMMLESVSSFLTLFRHALVAVGEPLQVEKQQVLEAAAARFRFAPASLATVLEARRADAKLEGGKLEPLRLLFAQYLAAIMQVERALEVSK